MSRHGRKRLMIVVEAAAVALVGLDLALYYGFVSPTREKAASEAQSLTASRGHIRQDEGRIRRLEKYASELPSADGEIQEFLAKRVPSRRRGYSQAASLVNGLTQKTGVQLTEQGYRLEPAHGEPLDRLALEIGVTGPFQNLIGFAHALETTDDFVTLRTFALEMGDNNQLGLRLSADLYVKP